MAGWRFYLSPRAPPSPWDPAPPLYALATIPMLLLARFVYRLSIWVRPRPRTTSPWPIRVVTVSDTHCAQWTDVPAGDLLIHAGDLTNRGTVGELQAQLEWLKTLPHAHKVVIAGNHDTYLDPRSRKTLSKEDRVPELDWGDIRYLQHDAVDLTFPAHGHRKLKLYAAPQIPAVGQPDWAFTYPPDEDAWSDTVPANVDILVTHGPPQWHLDLNGLGCKWLLKEIWRVRPRLHVFGHVHAGQGNEVVWWDSIQQAYERICARSKGVTGILTLVDVFNWIDLARMCWHAALAVAWTALWGGSRGEPGVQVNTALMYQSSGRLGNEPQVVIL